MIRAFNGYWKQFPPANEIMSYRYGIAQKNAKADALQGKAAQQEFLAMLSTCGGGFRGKIDVPPPPVRANA